MHFVVIGGGQAGLGVAISLAKSMPSNVPVEITLIDPKDYFEVRWASIRALFDSKIRKDMQIPYNELLSKFSIVHTKAKCVTLNRRSLTLSTGDSLNFDVSLVAIGARCPTLGIDPVSTDATKRRLHLAETGEKLLKANNVLIVGGGALGCELGAELSYLTSQNHRKSLSLVHSGHNLASADFVNKSSQNLLLKTMQSKDGMNIYLNQRVDKDDNGAWITSVKETDLTKIDLALLCTGYKPRNSLIKSGDLEAQKILDINGWIECDEFFRVPNTNGRIFAFGDCCNTGSNDVSTIFANYATLTHNLKVTLRGLACGKDPDSEENFGKFKKIKSPPNVKVITLGPKEGIADTPVGAVTRILPALKNKHMFISKALGYVC